MGKITSMARRQTANRRAGTAIEKRLAETYPLVLAVMGGAMIPSDLIERASAVRIEDEVERRGIKLVGRIDRSGQQRSGKVTLVPGP